jgi:hypothetical protein
MPICDILPPQGRETGSVLELAEAVFPEGKTGLMTFLKVFGDESYDKSLYCCGAFLGWPIDFTYLGFKWDDRLEKDGIRYFRASECENLEGEFGIWSPPGYDLNQARARSDSIRHDLLEIIKGQIILGISVCVVKKDFENLVKKNAKARKYFGTDMMVFTYKMLIRHVVGLIEQDFPEPKYSKLKAAFVFDEHGNSLQAQQAYNELREQNSLCAKRMLVAVHADDKEYPALQMADLMAYEARIGSNEWLESSDKERQVMKTLKKSHNIYFMGVMARKQLLDELKNAVYVTKKIKKKSGS